MIIKSLYLFSNPFVIVHCVVDFDMFLLVCVLCHTSILWMGMNSESVGMGLVV